MKVLFLSPQHPREMHDFTAALAAVGATVIGAGDAPASQLPERVRRALSLYLQVDIRSDPATLQHQIIAGLRQHGLSPEHLDRVEGLWELCVMPAAQLREAFGVPGMSVDTIRAFRDKTLMKTRLAEAGVRVPRFAHVTSIAEAEAAAERIGFPLIIKPVDGAGSFDTYRVEDADALREILPRLGHLAEADLEEFIEGEELTFDTVTLEGAPVYENVGHYFPNPLVRAQNAWVSPAQIAYRDLDAPDLQAGIALGRRVIEALGMETGLTHMEWFRTASGEAIFGEIAARPPGGMMVDLMNYVNDFDVFVGWAEAVCHGRFEQVARHRYVAASVFKRMQGAGDRLARIEGLGALRARCGEGLVAAHLPTPGTPRRDWRSSVLGDGQIIVRHPDLETCRDMMRQAVEEVLLVAG